VTYDLVNIVSTADLKQRVDIHHIAELPHTIHDQEIYGGRVTYLKTPQMYGKVTIFPSGKLISIGTKSHEQSQKDLETTLNILVEAELIEPLEIEANVRNIVAVTSFQNISSLEEIASITGAIYEPDQFPGAILKNETTNATYLIFQSGKIVISGTSSDKELEQSYEVIVEILDKC
jgi:transcription initiation factor TFIID TATA-box-binding protein